MAVGKRVMDRTPHLSDMDPAPVDSHGLHYRLPGASYDTEPRPGLAPALTPTTSIIYPDKERNTIQSGFTPMSPIGRPRSVSRQLSPVCTRHSLGSSSMSSYGGAVSPPDEVLLSPTLFSRTRADSVRSLKLIAGLPSEGKLSDCVTLNNESLNELVRDDFDPETRPPSPRPNDREQALLQHSKQMQIWEDSMRLSHSRSQTHDMDLASISFTRTSFSSDGPESLKRQAFSASTESDEHC